MYNPNQNHVNQRLHGLDGALRLPHPLLEGLQDVRLVLVQGAEALGQLGVPGLLLLDEVAEDGLLAGLVPREPGDLGLELLLQGEEVGVERVDVLGVVVGALLDRLEALEERGEVHTGEVWKDVGWLNAGLGEYQAQIIHVILVTGVRYDKKLCVWLTRASKAGQSVHGTVRSVGIYPFNFHIICYA